MLSARREDDSITTLEHIQCAMPGVAKTTYMVGGTILVCIKFFSWVTGNPDGLASDGAVAFTCLIALGTGIDNYWSRYRPMYRRELARLKAHYRITQTGPWHYPGVDSNFIERGGFISLQGGHLLYMANSVPGAFLNTFATINLQSRLTGLVFNPNCVVPANSPAQSAALIILGAHGVASYIAYANNSSFLSYNWSAINYYYVEFFIKKKIFQIKNLLTWLETIFGVGTNTTNIMYTGYHSLKLLQNATLCHLGIQLPDEFITAYVINMGIMNIIENGLMTLWAVDQRNTNKHEVDRSALARGLDISIEWLILLRTAIICNSIGAFLSTDVSIPHLPGIYHPELADLAYYTPLVAVATVSALISALNQYALSSESDVREREALNKIKENANEVEMKELDHLNVEQRLVLMSEEDEIETSRINIYNHSYGSTEQSNGHEQAKKPVKSSSSWGFFGSSDDDSKAVDADVIELQTDDRNRFNMPRRRNTWCSMFTVSNAIALPTTLYERLWSGSRTPSNR